jgi:dTDP-4-dehydrorhamnose reductase
MNQLEMWGGIECTLNRVRDRYVDQCTKNGHDQRLSDLELFKTLGIKKLRYPCLWEKVAPKDLDHCDWSFLDQRLQELQRLNLPFIAGFLHHGSGPLYTSLIDPDFPQKFGTFARLFATRYPWVSEYTPINEINTTARFCCLYGHWYPHHTSDQSYLRALLNQCKGTILAMREIRSINPKAKLIQTDDVGKCQSTELLAYQRDFENERRWLSYDVLAGKINRNHALFSYFMENGIREEELRWFEENSYPPDVIGINHYHLSNRFLDHRLELYPPQFHGGNGKHQYADVGAIDTGQATMPPFQEILQEAWDRFKIPIAVTECHTRGEREAQMRWLNEVWNISKSLRAQGVEIQAVTAWSLLGTYDWHNLCTNCEDFYEPGVFDLRNPQKVPNETGLSKLVRELASVGHSDSAVLLSEGCWHTPRRILWGAQAGQFTRLYHRSDARPILITGATGTLGQAFARAAGARNIYYRLTSRRELDIADRDSIEHALDLHRPWAIINAAGYVRVDEAERDQDKCFRTNTQGALNLARLCKERKIKLINFSSDLVFDGQSESAYLESHRVSPMNAYGRSKADCERLVLETYPDSLMVRTSAFFGPWDEHNFVTKTLQNLALKKEIIAPNDMFVSPTYVPDLAHECLNLLIDEVKGIVHLTNVGEVSWEKLAIMAAEAVRDKIKLNLDPHLIKGRSTDEFGFEAPRPRRSALGSERISRLPPLEDAIRRYVSELQVPLIQTQESRL